MSLADKMRDVTQKAITAEEDARKQAIEDSFKEVLRRIEIRASEGKYDTYLLFENIPAQLDRDYLCQRLHKHGFAVSYDKTGMKISWTKPSKK